MLQSTISASEKRQRLRASLNSEHILRLPGAFNPLSARLIERYGFEGVYVSGAVISADLGLPDIGLTTASEVATRSGQIARVTDLPVIVDADTGFGEPMNAARTVQLLEDAGVSGLHIEDQVNPKRCGHLDGKQVVDEATAIRRIRAASQARRDPNLLIIARTDIRASQGLTATIDRAHALVEAGADAVFPEALRSLDEFTEFCAQISVPVLANMTEFGKSELFTVDQLHQAGVSLVIFPVSLLRLAMGAADRGLATLTTQGSLGQELGAMQHRADLYDLLDYSGYSVFDSGVFDFAKKAP